MNTSKTALITGATSGIGFEMAKILAQKGYQLIITGRDKEKMAHAEMNLKAMAPHVTTFLVDFGIIGTAEQLYTQCTERQLQIDVLINNAGSGFFGDHLDIPLSTLRTMLTCNITNLTELCTLVGRDMKKRQAGMMLNIASTTAYQPVPYMTAYAASKAYVLSFSEALAKELENDGVTVTCYSPGATATNFFTAAGVSDNKNFPVANYAAADVVARDALRALEHKKLSVIHGNYGKITAFLTRLFPRSVVATISKRLMQK